MGLFISFEGGDGSGKGTQARLTRDWLSQEGYDVDLQSFPRYGNPVAKPIENFLNGNYGQLHPEVASVLYSLDRLMAAGAIREVLSRERGVELADRFTNSNLGHNGSKLDTDEERLVFFEQQRAFEYDTLGVPRPDHTFILMVPPEVAQLNVDKKEARSYTSKKRDIHEADATHLARTFDTYTLLAKTYPTEFTLINSMEADHTGMRTIEDIQHQLRLAIRPLLDSAF